MTALVTDRPVMATKTLVRQILEQHPEGMTDDELWLATGLSFKHHGSVVRRRKDAGAVDTGRKGVTLSGRSCTIWALPEASS